MQNNNTSAIDLLSNKLSLPQSSKDHLSFETIGVISELLTNDIARLDSKPFNSLVSSLINLQDWSKQNDSFIKQYITFLTVLTSGIPRWHTEIVFSLLKDFTKYPSPRSSCPKLGSKSKFNTEHHHEYFKYLLRIIPTSLNFFLKNLTRGFPDKYCSKSEAVNYVSNLFHVISYAPEIRYQLLSSIFEYCIKLDVELKNNLDELEDDDYSDLESANDEDDNEQTNSHIKSINAVVEVSDDEESDNESDDNDINDEQSDDDDELEGEETYNVDLSVNVLELSNKLDAIMENMFFNLKEAFSEENIEAGHGINIFTSLVSIFKSYILSTSNTKSIQFLLFYFSQEQPELVDAFLVTLIDIMFDFNQTIEHRIKTVQYLSSYLSRGKQIMRSQLIFVTSYLVSWLNKFVDERESEVNDGNGGMERFRMFYAVTQCLMYVFCFRHNELRKSANLARKDVLTLEIHSKNDQSLRSTDSRDETPVTFVGENNQLSSKSEWECSLDIFFQKLILTKFNPLKYCNETVVFMFAKLSYKENVAYCYSIINHNSRDQFGNCGSKRAKSITNNNKTSGSQLINDSSILFFGRQDFSDLVAYFPFDPIVLKRCRNIIQENYIEWS